MIEPDLAALREVPIEIYDFASNPAEGLEPGFYYNIPTPLSTEVFVAGPHPTRVAALDAARAFIQDCLTNYNEGTRE